MKVLEASSNVKDWIAVEHGQKHHREDVYSWCLENLTYHDWVSGVFGSPGVQRSYRFKHQADAVLFALRWA